MFNRLFKKRDKEDHFWDWFAKNERAYYQFETNQQNLFALLKEKLDAIHPSLTFEFSSAMPDGTREFVISADGIVSAFAAVSSLVEKAPKLKNWKVLAFRQPRYDISQIQYKNLAVDINDVFFRFVKYQGKIDLELHIKDFYESPEWTAIVFLILDTVLGEYYTATRIGGIEKIALDPHNMEMLYPLRSLLAIVEGYHLEINN